MNEERGPFHPGELAIQQRAGVREQVAGFGSRAIRAFMPEQHREFFAQLPILLVGSLDSTGQPSASLLWGDSGFVHSPQPTRLRIDGLPEADDPLAPHLEAGARLGILGLELPTRRRNRMNGRVLARDAEGFTVGVEQSFGNCPKYIQARSYQPGPRAPGPMLEGKGPDPGWLALVARSDTLFIASQHADPLRGGVDVSHRGGPPGFLRLGADGRLWLPDYAGNRLFNTLGNLLQEPRCGLLFIDFDNGDLLHLHAEAELFWPGSQPSIPWPAGAERLLALRPVAWRWRRGRLPLAFGAPQPSPFLPSGEY
ncbi:MULTISPECIES: pyridoxamine 5'-phosphate oxidase family protein [Pseudomonas aeruginosa group]|uniref:pyridoxamine 5'-phosphate oxidase family protein n=1 Tax=Pseudomonas aeruginosa group TaxID=136841 RepID=UPI00071B2C36|nr:MULTISPECIES: pyridoxamine 5'-phosphate oxidase family protein [Pseudomonas aeruginosa group]KSC31652.1 flavin-nucleotide-binding protein [Pseudomonas paraeruginosa]KSL07601.1 flavin-nucleotide-binding protein [Pseudomonas aeruginosa]MBH8717255.1 pyridoxamine 5'-phosphate oxidase family protein [Pseudomonas aeruginosa]MBH9345942.1 pyridoxamine 5'-phosphate oxidase family protein [Pseudomonas aeruginosa]MBI8118660.1 pyridoxamine 5'-phosphate oxidase family protein [Pseudomonas aeruginosa]